MKVVLSACNNSLGCFNQAACAVSTELTMPNGSCTANAWSSVVGIWVFNVLLVDD